MFLDRGLAERALRELYFVPFELAVREDGVEDFGDDDADVVAVGPG